MASVPSHDRLSIREATAADAAVILQHRRQMFYEMGHTDEQSLQAMVHSTRPLLEQWLKSGNYKSWLVTTDHGSVVAGGGMIVIPFFSVPMTGGDARLAMILNVYVERDYRRRGLARSLMEKMLHWCREHGFRSVSLHASEEGRPLYQQLGFRPTNEMRLML